MFKVFQKSPESIRNKELEQRLAAMTKIAESLRDTNEGLVKTNRKAIATNDRAIFEQHAIISTYEKEIAYVNGANFKDGYQLALDHANEGRSTYPMDDEINDVYEEWCKR